MSSHLREGTSAERAAVSKVETAAWGCFLLWVGISLLANLSWGVGLIGAGLITLAAQAWRKRMGIPVAGFSLVLGLLLVVAGVWDLLDIRVDLIPLLFIAAGVALLASIRRRREPGRQSVDPQVHRPA